MVYVALGSQGQPLAPSTGTSDLGTPAPRALLSLLFLSGCTCLSSGASRLCQPVSRQHHGEFAESPAALPKLSTNEEANAWDSCSTGRSEPSQPDGPVALPAVPSSARLSSALGEVLGCREGLGMQWKSCLQAGTIKHQKQ